MNILIISSKATSANVRVAIEVARAINPRGDITIVVTGLTKAVYDSGGVRYIQLEDPRNNLISRYKTMKERGSFWGKLLFRLYTYEFIPLIDSFFASPVEKEILKEVEKVNKNTKIDYLISTNNPYYAHRVAHRIINKFDKTIKSVQLWLDPLYLKKSHLRMARLGAKRLERRYLKFADNILSLPETFVSDDIAESYADQITYIELPYIKKIKTAHINQDIIFAGSFSSVRNPIPIFSFILDCIHLIDTKITFFFYCNNPNRYREFEKSSNGRIKICSYLTQKELSYRLSNCYMLLNIGNLNSLQMPSKVVDYISYRKPIINFYFDENDPSMRYLGDYQDILSVGINNITDVTKKTFVSFLSSNHNAIDYSDIMKVPLYRRSTSEYLRIQLHGIFDSNNKEIL